MSAVVALTAGLRGAFCHALVLCSSAIECPAVNRKVLRAQSRGSSAALSGDGPRGLSFDGSARRALGRQLLEDAKHLIATWSGRQEDHMPTLFSPTIGAASGTTPPRHWLR